MDRNSNRPFDLIVFGATGFTGRLVVEYLHNVYGVGGPVKWAIAGRNLRKLAALRDELGIAADLPLRVADAGDAAALDKLVQQARVVLTTVGPYQRHGQVLVNACASAGTDYVDLCGEPGWMAKMIPLLQGPAQASGARIVFSCGFDSVPFDLGVLFLQHHARLRFGVPLERVHGRVKTLQGGYSGGTAATLLATLEQARRDPQFARTLADPFALTPGFKGPPQPDDGIAAWDSLAESWTAPFVMAPINTKNVHRTHALLGHPWGKGFVYSERMLTGQGRPGEQRARQLARRARLRNTLLGLAPTRVLIRRLALPKPGTGPTLEQREQGRYELQFIGRTAMDKVLSATVRGDRDPGYGSTAKIVSEAALCLAERQDRSQTPGGVWTPGAAMGLALIERLQAHAGLTFQINDPEADPAR